MTYEIKRGQRLIVEINGKPRLIGINDVLGLTLIAVRGTPLEIGDRFVVDGVEWAVSEKRISTIKGAHAYSVSRANPG